MNKISKFLFAAIILFPSITYVTPALGQEEENKISPAATDFIENGIPATLAASCKNGTFPTTKCRNGTVILNPHDKEEIQGQEFDGLSFAHKAGRFVLATVTEDKWPIYKGLKVGTNRKKVLQVLGPPSERRIDEEDESEEILYWTPYESSVKFVFDEEGIVSEVTWNLYYD